MVNRPFVDGPLYTGRGLIRAKKWTLFIKTNGSRELMFFLSCLAVKLMYFSIAFGITVNWNYIFQCKM